MTTRSTFRARAKDRAVKIAEWCFFCEYYLTTVFFMDIPRSNLRIAALVYPLLVKVHKIWLEKC